LSTKIFENWVNSAQLTTFKPTVTSTVAHKANFEMRIAARLAVQARLILLMWSGTSFLSLGNGVIQLVSVLICECKFAKGMRSRLLSEFRVQVRCMKKHLLTAVMSMNLFLWNAS